MKLTENPNAVDTSIIVGSAWVNKFEKDGVQHTMLKFRLSNKFSQLILENTEELVFWENENQSKPGSPQFLVKVSPIKKATTETKAEPKIEL